MKEIINDQIGVYICHCGANISDYVDVEKVKQAAEKRKEVVLVKTTIFACADSAQKEIIQDIQEQNLNSIVIASCSPKLHLHTFKNVAIRAGLNPYKYVQVNIREQCSWAHSDNKQKATEKAISLVLSGIEKAKHTQALDSINISVKNTVVVVGAGVAGLRASIELADMGSDVYLIERDYFVGGRTAQWDELFTTKETGKQIIDDLYANLKKRTNIKLLCGSEIVENKGSIGNYEVKIKTNPRYIVLNKPFNHEDIDKAIAHCPVETNDEFNYNLSNRKAIYKNHSGQYPEIPVIDVNVCNKCGECKKYFANIDLEQEPEIITVNAGAILLTTGFNPYEPEQSEFKYKEIDEVITLQQFKRLITLCNNELVYNNKKINNIAYIYCVGSRQIDGKNKYCSRYCCSAAMHTAIEVKNKFKSINNYHFTREIRTYGKQEIIYHEAINNGDFVLKFSDDTPPEIEKKKGEIIVKTNDLLTGGMQLEAAVDLIVLITGMVPRGNDSIINILKIPKGRDNFYNEVHPKLKPVETVLDGIYIAGTCQGPKNISESVKSALSAAVKANCLLNKGEIELDPILAIIDKNICKWCNKCLEACPVGAITKSDNEGNIIGVVDKTKCKGCGMCLPVCPVNAIQLSCYTDIEMESMIKALVE